MSLAATYTNYGMFTVHSYKAVAAVAAPPPNIHIIETFFSKPIDRMKRT